MSPHDYATITLGLAEQVGGPELAERVRAAIQDLPELRPAGKPVSLSLGIFGPRVTKSLGQRIEEKELPL